MGERCVEPECAEAAIASVGERSLCGKHFIAHCYRRLEAVSMQFREPGFHENQSEAVGHFFEECMRGAADIACAPVTPPNLEKAQVVDILLWASELHGRLRRSPRVSARIPVLLRSEVPGQPWEEKTETQILSRYGAQVCCQVEVHSGDALTCIRLDNGRRAESRVTWTHRKATGELEFGVEFASEDNFWGLAWTERLDLAGA